MTTYCKIGFHSGVGGNRTGIGNYFSRLDSAGVPFVIKSVSDGGLAAEAAGYTNAPHVIIYRDDEPGGRSTDLPDYSLDPITAAEQHWARVRAGIPPEVAANKGKIWIESCNEPDKEHADWLGHYAFRFAQLANADGYKVIPLSMNYGEPERADWHTDGMILFLNYAAANTDKVGLGLHEGKLGDIHLPYDDYFPHIMGRFTWLLEELDDMGIGHPSIFITESQWSYRDMPESDAAMDDIYWLAEFYAKYPQVKGVCLWTLHGGDEWSDLPNKLQRLIIPLTNYAEAVRFPDPEPEPEPEPEPMDWRLELIIESERRQAETGINYNPKFAFIKWMVGDNPPPHWAPAHKEGSHTISNGEKWQIQGAIDLTGESERVTMAYKAPWSGMKDVLFLRRSEIDNEPEPEPTFAAPIGTESERAENKIWPGEWTDANPYGNYYRLRDTWAYHTGADLNLNKPTWDLDRSAPVYSVGAGIVTYAGRFNNAWGNLVIIRHDGFYTRSAHLGRIDVSVGQTVVTGQQIGIIGGADVGLPYHLHFDISTTDKLALSPGDWPGSDRARLLRDYVDPKAFLQGKVNAPVEPERLDAVDVSHHQLRMNWDKAYERGARLALIRATRGVVVDNEWIRNRNAAPKSGLPIIPYHFFQEPYSAGEQVANFLANARGYRVYAVDAEISSLYPAPNPNKVYNFVQGLKQLVPDARILLYTNLQWLNTIPANHPLRGSCDLWIAHWNRPSPTIPDGWNDWKIWQYGVSDDGPSWGASSSQIDVNYFNGSISDLYQYAGEPRQMPIDDDVPDPPPPPSPKINLLPYLRGDGRGYMVRHPSGGEEKFRTIRDSDAQWRLLKNSQWEQFWDDGIYAWRGADTSAGDGNYYRQMESGKMGARWCRLEMAVGETFVAPVAHTVQTYRKSDCQPVAHERNGQATNRVTLVALHPRKTWNGITLNDVIELRTHTGETMFFARGYSLVAWESPWGNSAISKILPQGEWDNYPESGCYG